MAGSRAQDASWDLNVWKMDTIHMIAFGLSFLQEVGTVGTVNDLPVLGPAFMVQVQVSGWALLCEGTERGTVGGVNRVLNVPLGNA